MTTYEIRLLRGKWGLSQRGFAELLSVNPATVCRWERAGKWHNVPSGPAGVLLALLQGEYITPTIIDIAKGE